MRKLLMLAALMILDINIYAQTTVTLNGSTYTLKAPPIVYFDGAGGVIDIGIKYNGGLAPKAFSGNPPWVGLTTSTNFLNTNFPYTNLNNIDLYESGTSVAAFAAQCYSDNTNTASCNAALAMLNNIQSYYPFFCDENQNDCIAGGSAGLYVGSYGIIYWAKEWMFAYQLMQSQMTSGQMQLFTDKILNDKASAGGISGSSSTSCTNPTTNSGVNITVASGIMTAASPLFGAGNPIQLGYWVAMDTGLGYEISQVVSVTDSTHASVASRIASIWNGYSGTISYRRNTWVTGDCGMMWLGKHGRFSPRVLSYLSGVSNYPSSGPVFSGGEAGGNFQAYTSNNTFSTYGGYLAELLSTVATDVNASVRSQPQITALYNDWFTNIYQSYVLKDWTGFHLEGSSYGIDRPPAMAFVNTILQNSLTAPPALGGIWDKNLLYHGIMNLHPGCMLSEPVWGTDFGANNGSMNADHLGNFAPIYFLYRNTNDGGWFNWMMRNRMSTCGSVGNTPGTNLVWTGPNLSGGGSGIARAQWVYALTDPTFPAIDISSAGPNALVLNQVAVSSGLPQSVLISRTGYSSITDTLVDVYGMGERTVDHNFPAAGYYPGDYRIIKGNHLLADDGAIFSQPYSVIFNDYNNGGDHSNYMEIGGAYNLLNVLNSKIPRGNSDGTSNRYAYAMVDSTASYVSGTTATRVHRHVIHFKESQDFIIVYDDVVTTSGKQKQTYLHYPNNFGASSDSTRGTTVVMGTQIASTNPGTGHGDATQILTAVLSPAGTNSVSVYVNNSDGTYTGGSGSTFRVSVCASTTGSSCDNANTEGEFIVVHEPVVGSGNTMPTTTVMATIDGNHRGVEVDGSSPKVAIFPRAGLTYTSATFTTAHAGTAQYLVTGLTAGTYSVTVGGVPVVSNVSVASSDNSLYFESTAGAFNLFPSGGNLTNFGTNGNIQFSGNVVIQ